MSCYIRVRLICWLEKREEERAVSDMLVNRRNVRWNLLWGHSANKLSQGETHGSRVGQRDRWFRGRWWEKGWCKRIERRQREKAVIARGGTTSRWESIYVL